MKRTKDEVFRLSCRMPAEWEPHQTTWLVWPHNRADWDVKQSQAEWCYVEIVRHLITSERVAIVYKETKRKIKAERLLALAGISTEKIDSYVIPTNRSWIRDNGPIFVVSEDSARQQVAVTDWGFNGWGRYRAWSLDDALPARIAKAIDVRRVVAKRPAICGGGQVVLEGGSIDVDGRGLLLTTEQCLLGNKQIRNKGMGREELESTLSEYLGVTTVCWLQGGIVGDDTNGHVDDVARFVGPSTVIAASVSNNADENYSTLSENIKRLSRFRDGAGRQLDVINMPMPKPLRFDGMRLPASYLNFFIANSVVLVPTFNDPADRIALDILSDCFKDREVVGIYSGDLILGLGALHCLTQQQPKKI